MVIQGQTLGTCGVVQDKAAGVDVCSVEVHIPSKATCTRTESNTRDKLQETNRSRTTVEENSLNIFSTQPLSPEVVDASVKYQRANETDVSEVLNESFWNTAVNELVSSQMNTVVGSSSKNNSIELQEMSSACKRVSIPSPSNNSDLGSYLEGYGGFCSQVAETSSQNDDSQGCSGGISHNHRGLRQSAASTVGTGMLPWNDSAETIPAIAGVPSIVPIKSEPPFINLEELLKKAWKSVDPEGDVLIEEIDAPSTPRVTSSDELFYQMAQQMLVRHYGKQKSRAPLDLLKQIFPSIATLSNQRKSELKLKILESIFKIQVKDGSSKCSPVVID